MAAFSSQYYHPFLVDSACLSITPPIINTSSTLPPSPHYLLNNNNIHIQETSYSVTNNQETSCVDNQSSKVTTISDTEYSVVNKNHSPETSMVVDKLEKGEQFTQKVVTPMEKEKKRRARNGSSKVTGKALVLDEIINYVQSLQNQVEFLSMKLALVNPMFYDLAIDLDTLMVRPDQKLNYNIASPSPCLAQFRPNQAIAFADTTTTNSFPTANNGDYLLDYSSSLFLQGPRSNLFFEYNGGQFWDVEDQRQKFLHPYGFGNNSGSFN
ncbi:hypothetical protein JHK85_020560 [Glycine max]|nr:hypothetical protein JHK85_020560 [Glycine max]